VCVGLILCYVSESLFVITLQTESIKSLFTFDYAEIVQNRADTETDPWIMDQ